MGKPQHQWHHSIGKLFWGLIGAGFGSAILLLGHPVMSERDPTSSEYNFKTAYIVYESEDARNRYRGFNVQDEIVVVGTVRLAGPQAILDAELISAGDRQQLQEDLGEDGKTLYGVGGEIALISLICLIKVLKN